MATKLPPKLDKAHKEGQLLVKTVAAIDKSKNKLLVIVVVVAIIAAVAFSFDQ